MDDVTFLLTGCLVLVAGFILHHWVQWGRGTNKKGGGNTALDLLKFIKDNKVFPVSVGLGWQLEGIQHDVRVWKKQVKLPRSEKHETLKGSFIRVKGAPQLVMNSILDIERRCEWIPSACHVVGTLNYRQISQKTKGVKLMPINHDIITVTTDLVPQSVLNIINCVFKQLQHSSLIKKTYQVERYWHREDNGCCWILEMTPDLQEWCFFLCQSVDGWFEVDHCIISFISYKRYQASHTPAASQLSGLQSWFNLRKITCPPVTLLTLPADTQCKSDAQKLTNNNNDVGLVENEKDKTAEKNQTQPNFIRRVKNMIEEKREQFEERRRRNNRSPVRKSDQSESSTDRKSSDDGDTELPKDKSSKDQQGTGRKKTLLRLLKGSKLVSENAAEEGKDAEGEVSEKDTSTTDGETTAGSQGDVSDGGEPEKEISGEEEKLSSSTKGNERKMKLSLCVLLPYMFLHVWSGPQANLKVDLGHIRNKELRYHRGLWEEEQELIYYQTLANQAAAEILAENLAVSDIDISRPYAEQAELTGGWVFYGLEKDIVILRKVFKDGSQTRSYLGKGLIPGQPLEVFNTIKSPRTRFTYDDMLKKVHVVRDFGKGLKIVHLHHEVTGTFKKDVRDFCVLQCERSEGNKFILSMKSVTWASCPPVQDVIRGNWLSSGWIIEPAFRKGQEFAMVTYIIQMDISGGGPDEAYVPEEIAVKQPFAIAYLRQYLAPSATIKKLISTKQHKRNTKSVSHDQQVELPSSTVDIVPRLDRRATVDSINIDKLGNQMV